MEYLGTIACTILFTVGFLLLYKFVIDPAIVIDLSQQTFAQCPDKWSYNGSKCTANYQTNCLPFDPTAPTLNTAQAKCGLARRCGTTWNGFCG